MGSGQKGVASMLTPVSLLKGAGETFKESFTWTNLKSKFC